MKTVDIEPDTSAEILVAIDHLSSQLCSCTDGRFDLVTNLKSKDKTLNKLAMRINIVLDKARRAMQEVRQHDTQTQAVYETAAEGIVTINELGVVEFFNAAAADMFGYAYEEVVGKNISMLMPSPYVDQHDQFITNYLHTGQPKVIGIRREVEGQRKNGTTFPVKLAVSEIQTEDGRLFTGIVSDLTELKDRQRELTRAYKMESIGELATGVAHEINTPMQFVADNLHFLKNAFANVNAMLSRYEHLHQIAKRKNADNPLVVEYDTAIQEANLDDLRGEIPLAIDQSLGSVDHMATIVRAIKDFSHPGTKERVFIDVNEAIESSIIMSRNEWKYIAEVVTDLAPDIPKVLCFSGEFEQVMLNLIVNAAHSIEDVTDGDSSHGTVTVTTRRIADCIEIRVSDTGTGIPEEILANIFDPFFTTKDRGKGSGQGLTVVRTIVVKNHGGTINVETQSGKGTTFVVRFPVSDDFCEKGWK